MLEKLLTIMYCLFKRYEVESWLLGLAGLAIGITVYSKDGTFLALIAPIVIGSLFVDIKKIDEEEEWP